MAYQLEMQNDLSRETLEALVNFNALDLMALVESPYRRKAPSEMHGPRQRVADKTFIVAERLFREKRIDEGIALLKAVLPPQAPDEGMLTAGYVSEALLEQKQFDLAWQIADSGRPLNRVEDNFFFVHERIDNINRYIQRTVAQTFQDKDERSTLPTLAILTADSSHFNLKNNMSLPDRERLFPPLVLNEEDKELYRKEAHRALEHLLTLPQQATDARVRTRVDMFYIPLGLAAMGYSKEAFEFADEANKPVVMRTILYERRHNGTPEEYEEWFQKLRTLYEEEQASARNDNDRNRQRRTWAATDIFIQYCLDVGKYLVIMDVLENHVGESEAGFGNPDEFFYRMFNLNAQTEYRHNSKELIERMIKHHEKIVAGLADGTRRRTSFSSPDNRSPVQIYGSILAAQVNLGLIDDALESLRIITNTPDSYTNWHFIGFPTGALSNIVFYVLKHKTPEEASRIEAAAIEMFKNADGAERRPWEDRHLIDYYHNLAIHLMQDDKAELGAEYLEMALEQAEKEQARREAESEQRLPFSFVESFVWRLAIFGGFEKAIEFADRLEERILMPQVRLAIAERYERMGETEKAKAALRKAFETISRVETYIQRDGDHFRGMAMLAIKLEEKALFDEIIETTTEIIEREKWYEGSGHGPGGWVRDFTRQLAVDGDKEHPLFEQAENFADGFEATNASVELYLSLGVSRAMLGDHDTARRLLKQGLSLPQERFMSCPLGAAVIEARSYER